MSESRPNKAATDEELIGVFTAISVVSRRLARKRPLLRNRKKHSHSKRSERFWQKSPVMASPLRSVTFS